MEKAEKAMEEVSESRRGSLSLGASNIPGEYILPQLIKRFKEKHPNVSISIDIADTEKIFSRVAERAYAAADLYRDFNRLCHGDDCFVV